MRYVSLHYILSFSNDKYGQATSISNIKTKIYGSSGQPPYKEPVPDKYYHQTNKTEPPSHKANAAFVILARNSDLNGVISSVKQMEDRFNKKFQYPYVFLNEQPFDENFKKRVSKLTDAKVEFGLIPREHWVQPDSIDETKASAAREDMSKNNVIYGAIATCAVSIPEYAQLSQGNTITNFKLVLLQARAPQTIQILLESREQNKVYAFTVSLYEYEATIPTLWQATKEFMEKNPELVQTGNAMSFLSDDGGETYNRLWIVWSNFEIADLELWRGEAYSKYFQFLDEKGGFYYERWGDAPVHSIGAALFAKKEQIHFFNDIGILNLAKRASEAFSISFAQAIATNLSNTVPKGKPTHEGNADYEWYSCLKKYDAMFA
ncbi:hypothetical protein H0H93_004476 [Arthromyces matolae]|nr:hypothetical protein H0H93_004476 [Arthromyces matolae]